KACGIARSPTCCTSASRRWRTGSVTRWRSWGRHVNDRRTSLGGPDSARLRSRAGRRGVVTRRGSRARLSGVSGDLGSAGGAERRDREVLPHAARFGAARAGAARAGASGPNAAGPDAAGLENPVAATVAGLAHVVAESRGGYAGDAG